MKHIGNIQLPKGAIGKKKRIGRGQGSGKGEQLLVVIKVKCPELAQNSRIFEGGQMLLSRRVPKFGFTNHFRVEYQVVNVGRLQELFENNAFEGNKVTKEVLFNLKAIRNSVNH